MRGALPSRTPAELRHDALALAPRDAILVGLGFARHLGHGSGGRGGGRAVREGTNVRERGSNARARVPRVRSARSRPTHRLGRGEGARVVAVAVPRGARRASLPPGRGLAHDRPARETSARPRDTHHLTSSEKIDPTSAANRVSVVVHRREYHARAAMTASSRFVVACRARVGAPLPAPPAHRWTRRARSPLARRPRSCGGARRSRAFCRRASAAPSRPADVGGGGACASRRPSRLHHARLSVVAKSSKASKVGRFPHVPSTDAHPIVRDGLDLGELCATWRAGAGAPGAAVVRDLEAMMMEAPREDPTAPRGDLSDEVSDEDSSSPPEGSLPPPPRRGASSSLARTRTCTTRTRSRWPRRRPEASRCASASSPSLAPSPSPASPASPASARSSTRSRAPRRSSFSPSASRRFR